MFGRDVVVPFESYHSFATRFPDMLFETLVSDGSYHGQEVLGENLSTNHGFDHIRQNFRNKSSKKKIKVKLRRVRVLR